LDEDHELERFFSGLPGFRSSKVVKDPLPNLTEKQKSDLFTALIGLLDRTFSSDLLPDPVKNRRAIICAKAIAPAEIPNAYQMIFDGIVYGDQHEGLCTSEFGRIVKGWADSLSGNQGTALVVQVEVVLTGIIAMAQRRNDSWFVLASDELGVQGSVLRDYAAHGDSLSLAILIHVTRQQFSHMWKPFWPSIAFLKVLEAASEFNVQDTSLELQHEFCALWNQIVLKAQNDNDQTIAVYTLGPIRDVYIALHQDTGAAPTRFSASTGDQDDILWRPSSYSLCNVAGHLYDDSAFTTFAGTVLHDNSSLVPASLASPEALSSSVPAPCHVVESLTHMPPLDNFHPAHQTTTESLRNLVTSPDLATAGAIRDIVTSAITIPYPSPKTSASTPPLSFAPPIPAVSLQHNPDLLVPSGFPNPPSSASSNPLLDNILPIGPPLPSPSTMTQSDL